MKINAFASDKVPSWAKSSSWAAHAETVNEQVAKKGTFPIDFLCIPQRRKTQHFHVTVRRRRKGANAFLHCCSSTPKRSGVKAASKLDSSDARNLSHSQLVFEWEKAFETKILEKNDFPLFLLAETFCLLPKTSSCAFCREIFIHAAHFQRAGSLTFFMSVTSRTGFFSSLSGFPSRFHISTDGVSCANEISIPSTE